MARPAKTEYKLPFNDDSGDRLKITYLSRVNRPGVFIEASEVKIFIEYHDVKWVIDILERINTIDAKH